MAHFIKLDELVSEPNRLTYHFSSSLDVFNKKSFFVEYEDSNRGPVESIHTIPFAAAMAPVSWATGAKLVMPSLDENYAESLERASRYLERWFSKKWSFQAPISAPLVRNSFTPTRHAMLFSGGLDSLVTYLCHRDKNPLLFTVFGADIPLSHQKFIAACRQRFDDFAYKENVSIHYIFTDVREIFNLQRLKPYAENWYGTVSHGLLLSSLTAPASYDVVQTLLMASCSHPPDCRYPCGSEKELVEAIHWGGTGVKNDNHHLSRSEKIRVFFKKNERFYPYLRVCWMQFESFNCGRCEKCLRTICELLLNNVDPALCNFRIDNSTLPRLKRKILSRYNIFFRGEGALDFWRSIRKDIRMDEIENRYGARDFFQWFAGFDKVDKRQNPFLLHVSSWVICLRSWAGQVKNTLKGIAYEFFDHRGIFMRQPGR